MYKPTVDKSGSAGSTQKSGDRRTIDKATFLLSRLRAYPVKGGEGECEMCGEVYKRGDWLKKLPTCKHKARIVPSHTHTHTHTHTHLKENDVAFITP